MTGTPVLPDLILARRWWPRVLGRAYCPACGMKWSLMNRWTMSALGYPMHYAMEHLGIEPFRRLS